MFIPRLIHVHVLLGAHLVLRVQKLSIQLTKLVNLGGAGHVDYAAHAPTLRQHTSKRGVQ